MGENLFVRGSLKKLEFPAVTPLKNHHQPLNIEFLSSQKQKYDLPSKIHHQLNSHNNFVFNPEACN